VPEASIDEQGYALDREDDVRMDAFDPAIDAEAQPRGVQRSAEHEFGPRIAAAHSGHDLGPGQWSSFGTPALSAQLIGSRHVGA